MVNSEEKAPQNIFTPLIKLRKESEALRKIEKSDNDAGATAEHIWANYGERSRPYDDDFGSLIRERDLKAHLVSKSQEYRSDGIPYCVLDLFSPLSSWLTAIQENKNGILTIDGGVANTLDDPRRKVSDIKRDERKNLYCVPGDISMPEVKQKLHEVMTHLKIDKIGFGAVFARPYGGANIREGDEEYNPLYYSFLRQVWSITSNHDGEIFCPIPATLQKTNTLRKWVSLMRGEIKADVEISPLGTNMKITRHQSSRSKLPGINELFVQ